MYRCKYVNADVHSGRLVCQTVEFRKNFSRYDKIENYQYDIKCNQKRLEFS